jgi:predicted solute-binding protein
LAPALLNELEGLVKANFEKGMAHVQDVAEAVAPKLNLSADFLVSYFNEFLYQMDDDAKKSERIFRDLVKQGAPHVASAAH